MPPPSAGRCGSGVCDAAGVCVAAGVAEASGAAFEFRAARFLFGPHEAGAASASASAAQSRTAVLLKLISTHSSRGVSVTLRHAAHRAHRVARDEQLLVGRDDVDAEP